MDDDIVTIKDVYREVTRMSGIIIALDQWKTHADATHKDHESRLRTIEQRWRVTVPASGGMSVIAIIAAIVQLLGG